MQHMTYYPLSYNLWGKFVILTIQTQFVFRLAIWFENMQVGAQDYIFIYVFTLNKAK